MTYYFSGYSWWVFPLPGSSTAYWTFAGVEGLYIGTDDRFLLLMDRLDDPGDGEPAVMSWPLIAGSPFSHILAPDYFIPTLGICIAVSLTQDIMTGFNAVDHTHNISGFGYFEKGI